MLQSSQTVMDLLSHCGHNSELHLKEMRNTKPHVIIFNAFPQNFWLFWILMLDFWGGWGWDPSLHDSCSVNKNPIKLISGRRKICDVMNAKHFFLSFFIYHFLNLFLFDFLNLFLSLFSFTPPFLVDHFLDPRKVFSYPRIYCQIVPSGTAFPPVHLDRKQHKTIGKHEKKPNHAN